MHPLRDREPCVTGSSGATFTTCSNPVLGTLNLVTPTPMNPTAPPPTPGLVPIYPNSINSQTPDQPASTEIGFHGTVNFSLGQGCAETEAAA